MPKPFPNAGSVAGYGLERLYAEGYRYLREFQNRTFEAWKTDPGSPWGAGVMPIGEDGTLGDWISYNFDSSG